MNQQAPCKCPFTQTKYSTIRSPNTSRLAALLGRAEPRTPHPLVERYLSSDHASPRLGSHESPKYPSIYPQIVFFNPIGCSQGSLMNNRSPRHFFVKKFRPDVLETGPALSPSEEEDLLEFRLGGFGVSRGCSVVVGRQSARHSKGVRPPHVVAGAMAETAVHGFGELFARGGEGRLRALALLLGDWG
ncbi:hypothetical protein F3Y22_tig00111096pilonHSYRG00078 [Hibiscus syriacus]|uniref:Uncharacterized protein n=1 Tax=Hibiscus syriacus TaxID=106335 RepID=A0A6A2Z276_HIBSY|nr:hypothetical protein F3Y22_tig00111096pilonHSYRG00078 [Hibiscus syriacus]